MKEKKKVDKETRRANMTFLQLIFPTFLLVLIPTEINGNPLYGLILKILIFGYQYFITQQFVNSIYN
jgi:hypothetical protein